MVSEFMLQQTPVARVLPVYEAWLERWPTPGRPGGRAERRGGPGLGPARLPAPGAAAARRGRRDRRAARRRGAGRLRRRCSRCPASATTPRPRSRRSRSAGAHAVLDTNVRRVLGRAVSRRRVPGRRGHPGRARARRGRCCPTSRDRGRLGGGGDGARRAGLHGGEPALRRLPGRRPRARGGAPASRRTTGRRGAAQTCAGTDRQCRGRLLAVLRDSDGVGAEQTARRGLARAGRNARAPWPACSTTGWSSRAAARATHCPAE